MSKRTVDSTVVILVLFCVLFFAVAIAVMSIFLAPYARMRSKLNTIIEQTAQVKVIKLDSARLSLGELYTVWFEFPDGTEKRFEIDRKIDRSIFKNETGTLTYKEINPSEGNDYDHRLYIDFKKDLDLSGEKENMRSTMIKDTIWETEDVMWELFCLVIIPIFILYLCFGGLITDRIIIRSSIKSSGGHAIKIKGIKTGIFIILRYRSYKVTYQKENQKIERIADFEKNIGGRRRELRLLDETRVDL